MTDIESYYDTDETKTIRLLAGGATQILQTSLESQVVTR